ncbi:MAG: ferritin family protein [Desulfobacteraceae bacterium]|nr:ferritin family protein [Desulfobacteraceae bacterium]
MTALSCTSVNDVIGFAIQKEELAMEFYRQCSLRTSHSGLKEFFDELAREEQRHRDMLRDLDSLHLDEVKLEKVEDLKISDYLADVPFQEDMTYQDALILAMKKEEKAHGFYATWKSKCMNDRAAKLFQILETEESKHKRKLETLYDDEILAWD